VINGGPGDDFLDGGLGDDLVDGEEGTDRCVNGETLRNCEA
jgi:RTX calcium-binding nonapeptide repeat (4 copies)